MKIKINTELKVDPLEMRSAYCNTLMQIAEENKDLVIVDADLMSAMGLKPFGEKYPEQTVNCGVQEANMYGVAAGLSLTGKIPFAHTFGAFASRRALDQIYMSIAYSKLNVKIVGSDPGITAALNGGTHMPFEDMGIMKGIPEMTVLEPTDTVMLEDIIRQISEIYGTHYLRLVRKDCVKIYDKGSNFEIGKMVKLREGEDVTIIASGYCVAEALKAAKSLEQLGIKARVMDCFTWKPMDKQAVLEAAEQTGAIVSAENHNIVHGLGSEVASVLAKNKPVPMEMVGVQDEFGEVGPVDYLAQRFQLTEKDIVEAVKRVLQRK